MWGPKRLFEPQAYQVVMKYGRQELVLRERPNVFPTSTPDFPNFDGFRLISGSAGSSMHNILSGVLQLANVDGSWCS